MKPTRILIACLALAASTGCSGSLDVEDYERDCNNDNDCVAVLVGDVCECTCEYGSISQFDIRDYSQDKIDLGCDKDCEPCPQVPTPVCREHGCFLR